MDDGWSAGRIKDVHRCEVVGREQSRHEYHLTHHKQNSFKDKSLKSDIRKQVYFSGLFKVQIKQV